MTKDKNVYGFGNNKGSQLGVINIGIPCTLTPQKVNALCQKGIKIMVCTNDLCLFVLTEEGKVSVMTSYRYIIWQMYCN